jgi:hypothetical protein
LVMERTHWQACTSAFCPLPSALFSLFRKRPTPTPLHPAAVARLVGAGLVGAVRTHLIERLGLAAAELERIGVGIFVACVPNRVPILGMLTPGAASSVGIRPSRQRSPRRRRGHGRRRPRDQGVGTDGSERSRRAWQSQTRQPARKRDSTHRRRASHLGLPWWHARILRHLQRQRALPGLPFTLHPSLFTLDMMAAARNFEPPLALGLRAVTPTQGIMGL